MEKTKKIQTKLRQALVEEKKMSLRKTDLLSILKSLIGKNSVFWSLELLPPLALERV